MLLFSHNSVNLKKSPCLSQQMGLMCHDTPSLKVWCGKIRYFTIYDYFSFLVIFRVFTFVVHIFDRVPIYQPTTSVHQDLSTCYKHPTRYISFRITSTMMYHTPFNIYQDLLIGHLKNPSEHINQPPITINYNLSVTC